MGVFGAGYYDLADVLPAVLAPVPHEERMRAVIGVAAAVHFDVGGVVGEFALVLFAQKECVARFGQQPMKKFDVRRVKVVIEFVEARMLMIITPPFFSSGLLR